MKRILLGMGVGLGLLVLPAALPGQGYIGPEKVPFGAGRPLEDHGGPAAGGGQGAAGPSGGSDAVGAGARWGCGSCGSFRGRCGSRSIWGPSPTRPRTTCWSMTGRETCASGGGRRGWPIEDLIEMLVHDSVEGFFIGQIEGFATRFLGSRYHRVDESGNRGGAGLRHLRGDQRGAGGGAVPCASGSSITSTRTRRCWSGCATGCRRSVAGARSRCRLR